MLSGFRNAKRKTPRFLNASETQALAPRKVFKSQKKMIAMRFLNASVLLRKALNRNLSWGFPLGKLLPKTRVLKHRVLERKRRPNANASVFRERNSARSFSDRSFQNPPGVMDVRAFGSRMSAPKCLFFQDFEGLTEVFAPGRPPGYPRGRPQDIWPQNLLFGLLFRS